MKSKFKSLLLAAAAVMLFAGCSNVALEDASAEGSDAGDKCVLSIGITGYDGYTKKSNSVNSKRTIAPDSITAKTGLTFEIEGKSARNYELAKQDIEFDDDDKSTTVIALEYDVWYLVLHANLDGKEVLRGMTTVDLRKANSGVVFNLSSKNLTGNGSLKVTLTVPSTVMTKYESGLYDVNTDERLYSLTSGTAPADNPKIIEITGSDIPAGDYIIKFFPLNENDESLGAWSDVINIRPGRETTGTATLDGLLTPPDAPDGFKVTLDADAAKGQYYVVDLSWNDKSFNEENFVLYLYNADSGSNVLLKKFDNDFYGDTTYWVEGTLGMSTKSCKLKLETGHLYEMELTAKNNAGESGKATREDSADFAADNTVNQQRFVYHLNGGKYEGSTRDNFDYVTYPRPSTFTLWTPAASDLKYNGHNFSGWVDSTGAAPSIAATDFSNIDLYATYLNNDTSFSFNLDDVEKSKTLTVTVTKPDSNRVTQTENTFVVKTKNSDGNAGGNAGVNANIWNSSLTFAITDEDIAAADITKMAVYVSTEEKASVTNAKSCECSLSNFQNGGNFYVSVTCQIGERTYSCNPILITVDVQE